MYVSRILRPTGPSRRYLSHVVQHQTKHSIPTSTQHVPVLLKPTIDALIAHQDRDQRVYFVDGTVGCGGHSQALLEALPNLQLLCIDRDPQMLAIAQMNLHAFGRRVRFAHGSYQSLTQHLKEHDFPPLVHGLVLDLGANSMHFDRPERGFSFQHDGPLDMRYDCQSGGQISAAEIVNTWSELKLTKVFLSLGQEVYAKEAAKAIVKARERGLAPIRSTAELRDVLERVLGKWKNFKSSSRNPKNPKSKSTNPVTKCFQALRMCVNGELEHLERGLGAATTHLGPAGRAAIISFHSLEDRMVKQHFRVLEKSTPDFRCCPRKPILPTAEEIETNVRARSAKLRILERVSL